MATYTIYADDDAISVQNQGNYATARETLTSLGLLITTNLTLVAGQRFQAPSTYFVSQVFMAFDTSVAEPGTPVEDVTISFRSYRNDTADIVFEVGAHDWDFADGKDNFVPGSTLSASPEYGDYIAAAEATPQPLVTLTGPADVPREARYGVMFWGQEQRTNIAPTGTEFAGIHTSRRASVDDWPYLTMVFPFSATAAITLDAIGVASTANLDCEASAAITMGDITLGGEAINGSRAQAAITFAAITVSAIGLKQVPVVQAADRSLPFASSLQAQRSITLE